MVDYIEYELEKLYAREAYNDEVSEWAERNCPELDLSDCDDWEQACIDYDDYCRSLHEDCEVV